MAKAKAECTCKVCGQKFYREHIVFNRSEAYNWEKWAIVHYDLCPNCHGKQMREEEIENGLYVDIMINASNSIFNSDDPIAIIFGGDTMPYKDKIKSLGAVWTNDYPTEGVFGDLLGIGSLTKRWVLTCSIDKTNDTINRVKEIGAKINSMPSKSNIAIYLKTKADVESKKQEIQDSINAELGPMPKWPDDINELWPKGATWNGKFYGKPNSWTVYFAGEKVSLTDNQKERMEETHNKRVEWKLKKKELEQKYKLR